MNNKGFIELFIASGILSVFMVGMFGSFGALTHYLYTLVKNNAEFNYQTMLVFFILGFFVAITLDTLMIDLWGTSYDGVLLLSGFLVIRILDFLDASGLGLLLKRLGVKIEER